MERELIYGLWALAIIAAFFIWMRIEKWAVQRRGRRELKIYKNPFHKSNMLREMMCPCGSGEKVKNCHGKEGKLSLDEYNEVVKLGKEYVKKAKKAGATGTMGHARNLKIKSEGREAVFLGGNKMMENKKKLNKQLKGR